MHMLKEVRGEFEGVAGCMQEAVLNGARQGLLRGADFLPEKAAEFNVDRHATIGDLDWESHPRPHLRWAVQPAKKSEQGAFGKSEYLLLPKGDGVTDAYSSIERYLAEREWENGGPLSDDAPLFWSKETGIMTSRLCCSLFKEAAQAHVERAHDPQPVGGSDEQREQRSACGGAPRSVAAAG